MDLKKIIRDIPDFPIKGVIFHDVSTILKNPTAFAYCIDELKREYVLSGSNIICAMDARGFILGGALALQVHAPLVLIRKKGKLPAAKISQKYNLEYGSAEIEIQDDLDSNSKVFLVDDLVATGGTLVAACSLIHQLGAKVTKIACVVNMPDLEGGKRLKALGHSLFSMVEYSGH